MRPDRVRFGPEAFRFQAHGGVSRYVVELHRALLAEAVDTEIVAGLHVSRMLDEVPAVRGRSIASWPAGRPRQALSLAAARRVARATRRDLGPHDVWHPSYFDAVPPGGGALVVTVFDMVHERYPDEMSSRDRTLRYKASACAAADRILCISQRTAEDLQEHLGLDSDRISVTPLGVTVTAPASAPSPFGAQPHVLFVGDRRPTYKGWRTLLDALVAAGKPDLGLLCVGPPVTEDDRAAVAERRLEARVRFETPSDPVLAARYQQALGLVYPSRYEGFGLPPLEALAQGCPVVTTPVGAIPEVVGGVAVLVEPDVAGIATGLAMLVDDDPAISSQRSTGPAHAARFTWASTATATLAAYELAIA
jgi:glycosyltransferase involved in cell wall biosynthesis